MSNQTVLVTGGGGLLGFAIVQEHLKRGDRVRSISRNKYDELDQAGVEQVVGDLRDTAALKTACEGVDVVHHVAAIAGIGGTWKQFYEINTVGTQNVIAACHQAGVEKLVYTSSPSVTFSGDEQVSIDESVGYAEKFNCHYPRSKALAEKEVLAANQPAKLLTCALRPHLIWGPRDHHLIPRLIERAKSGQLKQVGDGTNLIDTIYVENAALGQVLAADALTADSAVAGQAYFLSQGEPVNCWDWINQILAIAGLPPVKSKVSYKAAASAGAVLEIAYWLLRRTEEPRMSRFLAAQLAKSHYFDISKAQRDFGYSPRVSQEEGMRNLEAWLKQENFVS